MPAFKRRCYVGERNVGYYVGELAPRVIVSTFRAFVVAETDRDPFCRAVDRPEVVISTTGSTQNKVAYSLLMEG